jgi:hypothetical protein
VVLVSGTASCCALICVFSLVLEKAGVWPAFPAVLGIVELSVIGEIQYMPRLSFDGSM